MLDRLLKGTAPVTARPALRLEEQGWSNSEFWLRLQAAYDLATEQLRRTEAAKLPALASRLTLAMSGLAPHASVTTAATGSG